MVEWSLSPTNSPRLWQALDDGCVWEEPRYFAVGQGWRPLLEESHAELAKICGGRLYELVRVKQKFGWLDYWANPPEDLSDGDKARFRAVVSSIETRSWTTCEACSAEGVLRDRKTGRNYRIVLCDACDVFYPDPPWGPPNAGDDVIDDMKKLGYTLLQIGDFLDGHHPGPPEGQPNP